MRRWQSLPSVACYGSSYLAYNTPTQAHRNTHTPAHTLTLHVSLQSRVILIWDACFKDIESVPGFHLISDLFTFSDSFQAFSTNTVSEKSVTTILVIKICYQKLHIIHFAACIWMGHILSYHSVVASLV